MKKYLKISAVIVLALVLSLVSMGCTCKRVDPETMITTDTMANCLTAAQELFCSPTVEEKAEAASVLSFITSGVDIANMITDTSITTAQVQTIFALVQAGACVLLTDLQAAVAWYATLTSAMQTKVMTGKMASQQKMPPAIPALRVQAGKVR